MSTISTDDALEALLKRQRLWGTPVIDYPISMLQRRFRLGYTPTVVLMHELEKQGFIHRISETAVELTLSLAQSSLENNQIG